MLIMCFWIICYKLFICLVLNQLIHEIWFDFLFAGIGIGGTDVTDFMGDAYANADMTLEEEKEWVEEEMSKNVDFDAIHIDPAPFQLVEKTSLLKVHSLFSMVGVNHAYVTAIGKLIGVVGLKELRSGIENANTAKTVTQQLVEQTMTTPSISEPVDR